MSEAIPEKVEQETSKALVPPLSCLAIRTAIGSASAWIKNTTHFLDEGDEGYDNQQEGLSNALISAREAFDCKPDGCEMQCSGDDNFHCADCGFETDLDPLQ